MALQPDLHRHRPVESRGIARGPRADWRTGLPELHAATLMLREVRIEDAESLFAMLATDEVARFISPPPSSVDGFRDFIHWVHRERAAGRYACFAVVPAGSDQAIGLFQLRTIESRFTTGEWGFALGSPYWGTGMFVEGARLALDFAFDDIGTERLEARAAVINGRGNGALRKLGAIQEGLLRRSFLRDGHYHDQVLWSILAEDWRIQRTDRRDVRVH